MIAQTCRDETRYNRLGSGRWESVSLGLGLWQQERVNERQVQVPANMIAIGDSGLDTVSEPLLNPNADLNAPRDGPPHFAAWLPSDRHRGRANALFFDGHIEHAAQEHWIEKTDRARRRWNNDNQLHSTTW